MNRGHTWIQVVARPEHATEAVAALILANLAFNILANTCFKFSAFSPSWRNFLGWQVLGNLAGFLTVLTLTGLLRYLPLHVAFSVTTGLAVLGVQLGAASLLFHERIAPGHWLGAVLIGAGILLIGQR